MDWLSFLLGLIGFQVFLLLWRRIFGMEFVDWFMAWTRAQAQAQAQVAATTRHQPVFVPRSKVADLKVHTVTVEYERPLLPAEALLRKLRGESALPTERRQVGYVVLKYPGMEFTLADVLFDIKDRKLELPSLEVATAVANRWCSEHETQFLIGIIEQRGGGVYHCLEKNHWDLVEWECSLNCQFTEDPPVFGGSNTQSGYGDYRFIAVVAYDRIA